MPILVSLPGKLNLFQALLGQYFGQIMNKKFREDTNGPPFKSLIIATMYQEFESKMLPALNSLDLRAQQVLKFRYGLFGYGTHTLKEVGKKFGVVSERARQLEYKSLHRLIRKIWLKTYSDVLGVF